MEQSDNEYVCARLAANPSLPPEVLKEYLKAKRRVVRLAAYTNPSIPDGDLEKALRGRGTEKAAAMQNPKTPQRVRLLAGVEHNVINFTKGEPYIKCRKTPEELSFSSFFYRLGSSGAWEEKAGNEQLAREIRGWPLNKNSDIDFYVSPGTEGIEFEKLSSLEEAKSWFAWKSPESNKWTFCIRQGSQAGKEGLAAMTADLPVATDGWLSIKQHTDPNKYVIMGATPEGDKRRHYWITTGKKEKLLMNLVPPYNLKAEYPWPNKPTTTASLLGIFILYGGLFALWGVGGQPVGWTQEERAGDVPNKKILTKTKLCETKMISKILGRAESLLRFWESSKLKKLGEIQPKRQSILVLGRFGVGFFPVFITLENKGFNCSPIVGPVRRGEKKIIISWRGKSNQIFSRFTQRHYIRRRVIDIKVSL